MPDPWHAPWDDPLAAALHAPGASHQGYRRAGRDRGSLMTQLEEYGYLDTRPGGVNVSDGYPDGLSPPWMEKYQDRPGPGWRHVHPAEYVGVVSAYFTRLLGAGGVAGDSGIRLAPSCSDAFTTTAAAVVTEAGDEVIVTDTSFGPWADQLRLLKARVVFVPRAGDGQPDPAAAADAVTARTRAVLVVSPDNPTGAVCSRPVLEQFADLCREERLTLIADHSLAQVSPWHAEIPVLPPIALARALGSWMALGDGGKILGLDGSKLAAVAYPAVLRDAIDATASVFRFQLSQYSLALMTAVLSDRRFPGYLRDLNRQVAANCDLLRDSLETPLTVQQPQAGCFALVDAGTGLDGEEYARLLREEYRVLTVPVSWFPAGKPAPDTRIRISLNRPGTVIERAAAALSAVAAKPGR